MADLECYEDEYGIHWVDTEVGSEVYRGILITRFLTKENDTFVSVAWTVPDGLTEMDTDKVGDELRIKLSADAIGTNYAVVCEFNTTESGDTQKFIQTMLLTVV